MAKRRRKKSTIDKEYERTLESIAELSLKFIITTAMYLLADLPDDLVLELKHKFAELKKQEGMKNEN